MSEQTSECNIDATPIARGDVLLQKWVDGKPTLSAGALLPPHILELSQQTDEHVRVLANGSIAPLSQIGYVGVAATCCNAEMETFISRLVEDLGFVVCDVGGLTAFNAFFTCERGVKSFHELVQGIQDTPDKNPCPWIGRPGNCPVMSDDCRIETPDASYHRRRHCQLSWAREVLDTSVIQARKGQSSHPDEAHDGTTIQPSTKLTSTPQASAKVTIAERTKELAYLSTATVTTTVTTTATTTTTTTTSTATVATTTKPPPKSTAALTTTAKTTSKMTSTSPSAESTRTTPERLETVTTKLLIPAVTKGPATKLETVVVSTGAPFEAEQPQQASQVRVASTTISADNVTNTSVTFPSGAAEISRVGLWLLILSLMATPVVRAK